MNGLLKKEENLAYGEISKCLKVPVEEITLAIDSSTPVSSIEESVYSDSKQEGGLNILDTIASKKEEAGAITNKIAKIGEKISFRRFEILEKTDSENFGSYIHMNGKIGVLTVVEGASSEVAKDVSMHAAAMRPKYLNIESVPAEDVNHEREIQKQIAMNEGKPEQIAIKMVEGRIRKFYEEVCLTEQPFVKDDKMSVSAFVKANGGTIKNMVRYEVGEGMQKREENFAEEVAKQING